MNTASQSCPVIVRFPHVPDSSRSRARCRSRELHAHSPERPASPPRCGSRHKKTFRAQIAVNHARRAREPATHLHDHLFMSQRGRPFALDRCSSSSPFKSPSRVRPPGFVLAVSRIFDVRALIDAAAVASFWKREHRLVADVERAVMNFTATSTFNEVMRRPSPPIPPRPIWSTSRNRPATTCPFLRSGGGTCITQARERPPNQANLALSSNWP